MFHAVTYSAQIFLFHVIFAGYSAAVPSSVFGESTFENPVLEAVNVLLNCGFLTLLLLRSFLLYTHPFYPCLT